MKIAYSFSEFTTEKWSVRKKTFGIFSMVKHYMLKKKILERPQKVKQFRGFKSYFYIDITFWMELMASFHWHSIYPQPLNVEPNSKYPIHGLLLQLVSLKTYMTCSRSEGNKILGWNWKNLCGRTRILHTYKSYPAYFYC